MFRFSLKMNKETQSVDFTREILSTDKLDNEIDFLQKEGGILLGQIQIHEDYLNYLERNSKVKSKDIGDLQEMILKFFRILALIDAYQFLQSQNLMLTDQNMDHFLFVFNQDYTMRITKFIDDLLKTQF